jgi:vacuolar-type H+-ATPase catalytic subunit A/Vma1
MSRHNLGGRDGNCDDRRAQSRSARLPRNELGPEGRKRSVVVCATSERPAPLRVRACFVALAVAEYFRDQGANVLLVMDSVTRLAMAQREIGLARRASQQEGLYTQRVQPAAQGAGARGQFQEGLDHGFFTVLVEGDDFNEPICDAVRGILDGHFILSRQLGWTGPLSGDRHSPFGKPLHFRHCLAARRRRHERFEAHYQPIAMRRT